MSTIQILNGDTLAVEVQWEHTPVGVTVGTPGIAGLSAYQIALLNGFVGTESQWLESLKGEGGGSSSLTIREADGTPSGVVTELVFPNTSVAIAGGVGTLSVVPSFNTNVTGGQNSFQAFPPANAAGFASLYFASHSGLGGDNFGSTAILADAESGIGLSTDSGQVQITAGSNEFTITTTGYVISNTSAFRTAIDAAASSHNHDASAINAGTLDDARLSANIPRMVGGVIQASNLPSYVDDVLEFANLASFPVTGETGKIYVALNTNLTYRWSGSAYVELTDATAIWGQVTGTLSSQTDLQNALNARALSSHTHGNISNAGAIGSTADLPISTTASGVLNTRTVSDFRGLLSLNTERIQVALSANGQNISSGTKKGVVPILVAGTITAFRIDCDPANEPSAIAVQCDLNRINRTTGVATSVLSSVASIATGDNTGSGTINGTQSVAVGDMLTIDIDQGSDGRELIASITITLS